MTDRYLFRGKRVDNGLWVRGWYIDGYICSDLAVADCENFMPAVWCEVDPETVGQYTGLKDRNGKRIFEGDIVRFRDSTKMDKKGEIKYSAGAFLPIENGIGYTSWAIACEIIGDKFNTRSVE